MADKNLLRRKIDMRTKLGDFEAWLRASLREDWSEWSLRAPNIEGVEEGLVVQERGVINIERDLADDGERVLAVLEVEDPHVLRDQAAHRVERQPADRCFDSAFVQFFNDAVAPLAAKAALREIP